MLSLFPGVVVVVVVVVIVEFVESIEFCGSCTLRFRSPDEGTLNRDDSPFSVLTDSLYVGGLSRLLDDGTALGSSYIGYIAPSGRFLSTGAAVEVKVKGVMTFSGFSMAAPFAAGCICIG